MRKESERFVPYFMFVLVMCRTEMELLRRTFRERARKKNTKWRLLFGLIQLTNSAELLKHFASSVTFKKNKINCSTLGWIFQSRNSVVKWSRCYGVLTRLIRIWWFVSLHWSSLRFVHIRLGLFGLTSSIYKKKLYSNLTVHRKLVAAPGIVDLESCARKI